MNPTKLIENIDDKLSALPGRCTCKGNRTYTSIGEWEGCPLEGQGHTAFSLLKCNHCGGLFGFPDSNLDIALEHGTPATKAKLHDLFETAARQQSDATQNQPEAHFSGRVFKHAPPEDDLDLHAQAPAPMLRTPRLDSLVNFAIGFIAGALVMETIHLISQTKH
jgi:hypothetical protein